MDRLSFRQKIYILVPVNITIKSISTWHLWVKHRTSTCSWSCIFCTYHNCIWFMLEFIVIDLWHQMTPLSCLLLKLDQCLEISPGLVHDSAKLHLMSITLCGVITRLFPLPFILSCPLSREPHPPNTHKINHILLNQPQTHQFIDSCPVSMVHDTGLFPQSSSFVSPCL